MHGTRDEAAFAPPPFEIVLRGFHRQQVIDHLNALKARVATIGAERDAALQRAGDLNEKVGQLSREAAEATRQLDRLQREASEAATEIDRLQRSPLTAGTVRIQQMLQIAEDEAAELQTATEKETTSLRENTRAEAARLLAETRQQCERLEAESNSRRQAVEAEFEARHQRAEQKAERDIVRREAETDAWIRDYQTHSVAALYLLMQLAGERLSSRVVKVKKQVNAARQLRSEVTDQLSEVHRLLVEALGVADQRTAAEQAEHADDAESALSDEAESSDGAPALEPAGNASGSGGPHEPRQRERPGPAGRPRQPDEPTARFGLHP
jgi:chromosome segregation ATPase